MGERERNILDVALLYIPALIISAYLTTQGIYYPMIILLFFTTVIIYGYYETMRGE